MKKITHLLSKHQLTRTSLRSELLHIFEHDADVAFSVADLLEVLAENGSMPNKTSLYREVSRLTAKGILEEFTLEGRATRYKRACCKPDQHHHHLVCERCQRVLAVSSPDLENAVSQAAKATASKAGFTISRHSLLFTGRCSRCKA